MFSLQYLFFVLYERSRDWAVTPAEKTALSIGVSITIEATDTPNYSKSGLSLPSSKGEAAIDKALKIAANWEEHDMAHALQTSLNRLCTIHGKTVDKMVPELDPGDGFYFLQGGFRDFVQARPDLFYLGPLMARILHHFKF